MSKGHNNESSSFYQAKAAPFVIEHEPAAELTSALSTPLSAKETDCLLLLITSTQFVALEHYIGRDAITYVQSVARDEGFKALPSEVLLLHRVAPLKAKRLVLAGIDDSELAKLSPEVTNALPPRLCKILKNIFKRIHSLSNNIAHISLVVDQPNTLACEWFCRAALRTFLDTTYQFEGYKTQVKADKKGNKSSVPKALTLITSRATESNSPDITDVIAQELALNEGLRLAKDLSHMPANLCTPDYLANTAHALGQAFDTIHVNTLGQSELNDLEMNGYLAVNAGSAFDASMPIIHYTGNPVTDAKPIVLIGKGVTFDSGGITLKRSPDMHHMIYDMAGAACVLGVIKTAAQLGLNLNIIGILATAENSIDGGAYRPGDIITMHAGHTVEVMSTDAEGRMLMADAISYSQQFNPHVIIDIATLTGAAITALGHHTSALFCNSPSLESALMQAGDIANDSCWPFPLWPEYQEAITSPHADMMNTGINSPGAISAGCFLSRYASNTPWAHLDVAGTAFKYGEKLSATGRPIPLLLSYLLTQQNTR
ncbi:MAG: hypothetical protein AXW14_00430 [Alteromonas sp. Nap_26]|nr:MAG: hypothetical protein AXW14_00430 [Alteromonas sp. Nap_26]